MVFYNKDDGLYWLNVRKSQQHIQENKVNLSFALKGKDIEVLQVEGIIHLYLISQEEELYEVLLDEDTETVREVRKISRVNILAYNSLSLTYNSQEKAVSIWYPNTDQSLIHFERKIAEDQWVEKDHKLGGLIGTNLIVKLIKGSIKVFFLSKKILARYYLDASGCFSRMDYLPPLIWEEISSRVKKVGAGYFSECYYD